MQASALSAPAIAATLNKNDDVFVHLFSVYRTRPRPSDECLYASSPALDRGTLRPAMRSPQRARRLSGWGGECHDHVEHPLL